MFGRLRKYKESAYFNSHRIITFDTLYEDGQYLTLDRDRILAEAEKAVKALYA